MKKFLSLVLAAIMLLSIAAIPGALADEYDYKIVVQRHALDKEEEFDTKPGAIMAEQRTGLKIDYYEIDAGAAAERINLMLATNDLPDAFINGLDATRLANNLPLFVALDEYLTPEIAPNICAILEQYPEVRESITQTDGCIYTLPTSMYVSPEDDGGSIQFINKAWLDKLNLEMPTTTDEFYEVCKAIKAGDPNGNGLADEIPVLFTQNNWAAHIQYFFGPWGITEWENGYNAWLKIENGKVIFTPTLPEFRAALEYWHKFAKEGLLDVEGFTMTNQQFYARLKEYIGVTYRGWTPASNFDSQTALEFVALPPLQASDYPEIRYVNDGYWGYYRANSYGFAITAACENPEELVKWYDAMQADKVIKMTWRLGEEGTLWELGDDGTIYELWPDSVTVDFTRENMKYTYGAYGNAPAFMLPNEVAQYHDDAPADATVRRQLVDVVKDYLQKEIFPKRNVDADKLEERDFIQTEMSAYLENFVADAIVNGIDDAKWEKHLKDVEAYKVTELVEWWQGYLDGEF